jgi:signal transduction histidine kinase
MLTSQIAFWLPPLIVGLFGLLILIANPIRAVNRAIFTCSLHIAIWLICLYVTFSSPEGSGSGLYWFRVTCAVGSLIALHFWVVKQCIAETFAPTKAKWYVSVMPWLIPAIALATVPLTEVFIPAHSTGARKLYGPGYYAFVLGLLGFYGFLFRDAFREIRKSDGGKRLALQVWLVGGCATAVTIIGLMVIGAVTHDHRYVRFQPVVAILFYAGTAFAITTYRVFDARQIIVIVLERSLLVALITLIAVGVELGAAMVLPTPFDLLLTTALALWLAAVINEKLNSYFRVYPQATAARKAAFDVSRRETRAEPLEAGFLGILKGWGQSDRAILLYGGANETIGEPAEEQEIASALAELRVLKWATPERIAREKATPGRNQLMEFMQRRQLGIMVLGDSPTLNVIAGVGVALSRRPFTYPQAMQLMELTSIFENVLERAHLLAKAQRAEQLATVGLLGASFAHEIRNPLVSIKTFAQLLPHHYQDQAFRDKFFRLIGDEVTRIDRLTEQLMDLASPRMYSAELMSLHPMLAASLDLVASKANDRSIEIITAFEASPDLVYTDAAAAKQVLLNLCFNAIQASENLPGHKWVRISTKNTPNGVEMAVADNGPGIAPEMRSRLFQPFQTTKSTGFGLGLAICGDILASLNATIAVDETTSGSGATFRVNFPCQPS